MEDKNKITKAQRTKIEVSAPARTAVKIMLPLLLLAIVGGALWYNKDFVGSQFNRVNIAKQVEDTKPFITPTFAEFQWIKYTHSTQGYRFEYPTNWKVQEDSGSSEVKLSDTARENSTPVKVKMVYPGEITASSVNEAYTNEVASMAAKGKTIYDREAQNKMKYANIKLTEGNVEVFVVKRDERVFLITAPFSDTDLDSFRVAVRVVFSLEK